MAVSNTTMSFHNDKSFHNELLKLNLLITTNIITPTPITFNAPMLWRRSFRCEIVMYIHYRLHTMVCTLSNALTYPSSLSLQPGHQVPAHHLAQAVHKDEHCGRPALSRTVHSQGRCHRKHGHHPAPGYTFSKRKVHTLYLLQEKGTHIFSRRKTHTHTHIFSKRKVHKRYNVLLDFVIRNLQKTILLACSMIHTFFYLCFVKLYPHRYFTINKYIFLAGATLCH